MNLHSVAIGHLPKSIVGRWRLPPDLVELIERLEHAISPSNTAWILGLPDYLGTSGKAFAWNEFEGQSLASARQEADARWERKITAFWDVHFPLLMAVQGCWMFFGLRVATNEIVHGTEPEYEDVTVVARDLDEFLARLVSGDPTLCSYMVE